MKAFLSKLCGSPQYIPRSQTEFQPGRDIPVSERLNFLPTGSLLPNAKPSWLPGASTQGRVVESMTSVKRCHSVRHDRSSASPRWTIGAGSSLRVMTSRKTSFANSVCCAGRNVTRTTFCADFCTPASGGPLFSCSCVSAMSVMPAVGAAHAGESNSGSSTTEASGQHSSFILLSLWSAMHCFVRKFACLLLLSALAGCTTPLPRDAQLPPPETHKIDGCSLAPDFDFEACCDAHDEVYWRGGTCAAPDCRPRTASLYRGERPTDPCEGVLPRSAPRRRALIAVAVALGIRLAIRHRLFRSVRVTATRRLLQRLSPLVGTCPATS